jgi:hypothetical protein
MCLLKLKINVGCYISGYDSSYICTLLEHSIHPRSLLWSEVMEDAWGLNQEWWLWKMLEAYIKNDVFSVRVESKCNAMQNKTWKIQTKNFKNFFYNSK